MDEYKLRYAATHIEAAQSALCRVDGYPGHPWDKRQFAEAVEVAMNLTASACGSQDDPKTIAAAAEKFANYLLSEQSTA